jgi:hypothetical protein
MNIFKRKNNIKMLDFYLINDDQPKPSYPEQVDLIYIAGLDSKTFANLVKKGIIDSRFDYYSDFRWNMQLVEQLNSKALKANKSDLDIGGLKIILDKAMDSKNGLIAFGD